ncbi:hypothetical protein Bbelb_237890 [Branchiostoma belcheri]|nr:hypothetical protein Bbelb_237890 [Branchiostoma belcheri]
MYGGARGDVAFSQKSAAVLPGQGEGGHHRALVFIRGKFTTKQISSPEFPGAWPSHTVAKSQAMAEPLHPYDHSHNSGVVVDVLRHCLPTQVFRVVNFFAHENICGWKTRARIQASPSIQQGESGLFYSTTHTEAQLRKIFKEVVNRTTPHPHADPFSPRRSSDQLNYAVLEPRRTSPATPYFSHGVRPSLPAGQPEVSFEVSVDRNSVTSDWSSTQLGDDIVIESFYGVLKTT